MVFSRNTLLTLSIFSLCGLCGCESTERGPTTQPSTSLTAVSSNDDDHALDVADGMIIGPETNEFGDKGKRLALALEGLTFEGGFVQVTPNRRNDAALALRRNAEGDQLLDSNRVFEAIRAYRVAIQTEPSLALPYYGLGMALQGRGQTEYAIASFATAKRQDPTLLEARFALAMALQMNLLLDDAIAEMLGYVELNPENALAHERLAIWYRYAGNLVKAWDHTHAAQALGHTMPGQFVALLQRDMPDPRPAAEVR